MTTTSGIYCITHTATGRRYVGSAVNVSKRWITHKSYLRGRHDSPILQHGWNKHGAETRAKQSAALKGRKQSPAHVAARVAGRAAFFAKRGAA